MDRASDTKDHFCDCEKYCSGGDNVTKSTYTRHAPYRKMASGFSSEFQQFLDPSIGRESQKIDTGQRSENNIVGRRGESSRVVIAVYQWCVNEIPTS